LNPWTSKKNFRELNLIEQWGSGISCIFREAETLGLPELQIEEIGMRVRVTVAMATLIGIQEPTEQLTEQLTEQVKHLLAGLKDEPLGGRDAMQALGLRHRPTFLYNYLQPAIDTGFVEMTQPESPKNPTQKYRLTAKGKAVLTGRVESEEDKA
jgi:ATP-dependent DNA helicase RecG